MAIIKCPECGRQVSERAPMCPGCGVEIAGKIIRCSDCGEVYFIADRMCPSCHRVNAVPVRKQSEAPVTSDDSRHATTENVSNIRKPAAQATKSTSESEGEEPEEKKKSNFGALIISFIFAAVLCGAMFYFYQKSQTNKEEQEYELAIKSNDTMILKAYLNKFKNENPEHVKEIQARLDAVMAEENDWNVVSSSNVRSQLVDYMQQHPDSKHKGEIANKIDSLDWVMASKGDDESKLKTYINEHPNGRYVIEAEARINKITTDKETKEKEADNSRIREAVRNFFVAINSHSETSLRSSLSSHFDSCNGNAGADAAVSFMNSQYKDGAANFNWVIDHQSYSVTNKTTDDDGNLTLRVTFNVTKEIEGKTAEDKKKVQHKVTATIAPDGKISKISIN